MSAKAATDALGAAASKLEGALQLLVSAATVAAPRWPLAAPRRRHWQQHGQQLDDALGAGTLPTAPCRHVGKCAPARTVRGKARRTASVWRAAGVHAAAAVLAPAVLEQVAVAFGADVLRAATRVGTALLGRGGRCTWGRGERCGSAVVSMAATRQDARSSSSGSSRGSVVAGILQLRGVQLAVPCVLFAPCLARCLERRPWSFLPSGSLLQVIFRAGGYPFRNAVQARRTIAAATLARTRTRHHVARCFGAGGAGAAGCCRRVH